MKQKNRLNEVPLANITEQEVKSIQEPEKQLGDKYYLIAFKKD